MMNNYSIISLHKATTVPVFPKGFLKVGELVTGSKLIGFDGAPVTVSDIQIPSEGTTSFFIKPENTNDAFIVGAIPSDDEGGMFGSKPEHIYYTPLETEKGRAELAGVSLGKGIRYDLDPLYLYNSPIIASEALRGILSVIGGYDTTLSLHYAPASSEELLRVFKVLLSILNIPFKIYQLEFEYFIVFKAERFPITYKAKRPSDYLTQIKETFELDSIYVPVGNIGYKIEKVNFPVSDFRVVRLEGDAKGFLVTESFIPLEGKFIYND